MNYINISNIIYGPYMEDFLPWLGFDIKYVLR